MANVYQAQANDGRSYEVSTPHHHDDHPDATFKKHLLDIIKSTFSGVLATGIAHYTFKGRR